MTKQNRAISQSNWNALMHQELLFAHWLL